jgi:hypothetical protein
MTWQILVAWGIPGALVGLVVWYFKKRFEKSEAKQAERQSNLESLILMMLQSNRANTILCKATAEAVRDGHCNGNMTAAMQAVDKVAEVEKQFLLEKSISYIFE